MMKLVQTNMHYCISSLAAELLVYWLRSRASLLHCLVHMNSSVRVVPESLDPQHAESLGYLLVYMRNTFRCYCLSDNLLPLTLSQQRKSSYDRCLCQYLALASGGDTNPLYRHARICVQSDRPSGNQHHRRGSPTAPSVKHGTLRQPRQAGLPLYSSA